jgi:protein-tyrosine phosphatase
MNRLLFLCTGNYYRSRFAEIFFNSLASEHGLNWKADSRGLALDLAGGNIGPMSDAAFEKLADKGIRCASMERFPAAATNVDFQAADLIIALDKDEHRPMMRERFPGWEQKIDYWLVHDLDQWEAKKTLSLIETEVSQLVNRLLEKAEIVAEPGKT